MSYIRVPIVRRDGTVVGHAKVDAEDAYLVANYTWRLHSYGYATVKSGGVQLLMHRLIMGLKSGDDAQVDHINLDKLNNQRSNLRLATNAQNGQNVPARKSSSPFRGVSWDRRRKAWKVTVDCGPRQHFGGLHASEEQAALAAHQLRRRLMPYANTDPVLIERGLLQED